MKIPRVWECCKEWGQLASQGTFQAGLGSGPEGAGQEGGNSSVPPWGSSQPAPSPFLATPSPNPGKRHLMGLEDIVKKRASSRGSSETWALVLALQRHWAGHHPSPSLRFCRSLHKEVALSELQVPFGSDRL